MCLFFGFLVYVFVKFSLKYGFQYIWHSNHSGVSAPSAAAVEASVSQQKLTETVEQLKNTCDGLAKKIKRRRSSNQPKFIIMESASRVQEIKSMPLASIDSGASGDKRELDTDTSVDSDVSFVDEEVAVEYSKVCEDKTVKVDGKPSISSGGT
jgi:hypothetical protein